MIMRNLLHFTMVGGLVFTMAACQQAQSPVESAKASVKAPSYQGPTFEDDLNTAKVQLDEQMALPITVPTPKGEKKYADFAGQMMLAYADVYPSWGIHPAKKEQSPGRMYWQNLNESMWLLNASFGQIGRGRLPQTNGKVIFSGRILQ